jgi:F0F1-type ATP synthase assembly protein I
MSQRPPGFAPGMVLAQVSVRVIVPLLVGVIAGLVADGIGDTSPRYVLIGLVGGTLVSALWLRTFVVSTVARMRRARDEADATATEKHEHNGTEGK